MGGEFYDSASVVHSVKFSGHTSARNDFRFPQTCVSTEKQLILSFYEQKLLDFRCLSIEKCSNGLTFTLDPRVAVR